MAARIRMSPPLVSNWLLFSETPKPVLTLVLAKDPVGDAAPLMVRLPPLVRMLALLSCTEPLPLLLKLDSSETFNVLPLALLMLVLFITILR